MMWYLMTSWRLGTLDEDVYARVDLVGVMESLDMVIMHEKVWNPQNHHLITCSSFCVKCKIFFFTCMCYHLLFQHVCVVLAIYIFYNNNLTFILKQVTLTCVIYPLLLMTCKRCDIVHMHCFVPVVKQISLWYLWAHWPTTINK